MRCGLLGETLGHSYSPAIHALLADYEYRLYSVPRDGLDGFLRGDAFDALNVTIPYKKAVVPYCAALSPTARRLGSVNTLVRRADGTLFGDNTDYFGFSYLLRSCGISAAGRKALVLGSGGASVTVCAVLEDLGASEVVVISRSGENNYHNLSRHADAQLIVNTTPLGMYPENGASAVDLADFPRCAGVVDLIYNPARTALLLQAEARGIPCAGGLSMLVAQAKQSAERFIGRGIDDTVIPDVTRKMACRMRNIVLIGMPGCGKSSAAKLLARSTGREVADTDDWIERESGKPIPQIFAQDGEEAFRRLETAALAALGKRSGCILATGGGCVTREENRALLRQNGVVFWLRRDLSLLAQDGRPLSQRVGVAELYRQREPLYVAFADAVIDNNGSLSETVRKITEVMT